VVSVSESLYRELKMDGASVSASVLCPGYVATSIGANSERDRPRLTAEPAQSALAAPNTRTLADTPGVFAPEYIAEQVMEAIREDRFYILATQEQFLEWMHMRHRRLEEQRNPAVPRRSLLPSSSS
jgi:short-subunit dehydrogenase